MNLRGITGLKRLSKRERMIAAFTTAALLLGGLYVYVVEPLVYEWIDVHDQAMAKTAELEKLQSLIRHRDEIEKAYQKTQGAIATGVSDEDLTLQLIRNVERIARENQLDVKSVKPSNVQKQGGLSRYGVQISADGEPHQFIQFLQGLQKPENFLCADVVTLTVRRTRPTISVSMSVSNLAKTVRGGAQPAAQTQESHGNS